jgi:hypothetical protein
MILTLSLLIVGIVIGFLVACVLSDDSDSDYY